MYLARRHLNIKPTSMRPRVTVSRYLFVYDADCGPCSRFKRAIDFLDAYGRLEYSSLMEADEEGVLNGIPHNLRHRSFHLISPAGMVLSGAKALSSLIGLLPSGRAISKFIFLTPGGVSTMSFVYSVFSRLHNTGSCGDKPGSSVNVVGNSHDFDPDHLERSRLTKNMSGQFK